MSLQNQQRVAWIEDADIQPASILFEWLERHRCRLRYANGPQCAFLGIVIVLELTRYRSQPTLLYPLDDAYIHMALARTLLTTGTWGMIPGNWGAASSSPLWTIILAGLAWLPTPAVPLVLNVLIGSLFIAFLERLPAPWPPDMRGSASNNSLAWSVFYAAPIPLLAILGMEHLLHAFLIVLLVYHTTRAVAADADILPVPLWAIGLLSALAMLCRYETVAPLALLLILALGFGRWRIALALAAGLLPTAALALYGFITVASFYQTTSISSQSRWTIALCARWLTT